MLLISNLESIIYNIIYNGIYKSIYNNISANEPKHFTIDIYNKACHDAQTKEYKWQILSKWIPAEIKVKVKSS